MEKTVVKLELTWTGIEIVLVEFYVWTNERDLELLRLDFWQRKKIEYINYCNFPFENCWIVNLKNKIDLIIGII